MVGRDEGSIAATESGVKDGPYRFQIVLVGFIAVLVLTNRLSSWSGQVA
jgi:hypothetical protein